MKGLKRLCNQLVGCAACDMLMASAVLRDVGEEAWGGMYRDVTTKVTKVRVLDKGVVLCNENETSVVEPRGMQGELRGIMERGKGRVFVRASNTEDVVRVFAESEEGEEKCEALAREAEQVVRKYCGARSKM
ncbi:hypothetical protein TrRE_jg4999 [Triparma retinervis]|uniref:Alpha-D-phosphohexomutase C-terminal domain-containing protein n=1 Tax=Triparma retinervis TaxID=2557542 RepID=A0A9W6ZID3_9STRA|nr:hypothetical protein TrRE_jg4999 [Triparma retinervis]